MSRHPAQHESDENTIAEEYVNFITANAVPKAITLEEIKHHTREYHTLQTLIDLVRSGRWNNINQIQDPSVYYLLTGCKGRTRKYKPKVFHTTRACEGCLENQGLVFLRTARAPS